MDEPVKILCVDDEANVLKSLNRLFLEEDYSILNALSGEEGLELLQQEDNIQIVISDYRMPGMNGVDFLQEVRRIWPETIRIVLSGYADLAAVVSAVNDGEIYKFIPKPWNDDNLRDAITNAVERHRQQKTTLTQVERLRRSNRNLKLAKKSLEDLLREQNSMLDSQNEWLDCAQKVLNELPLAFICMDGKGKIIRCNPACKELFEENSSDLLQREWGNLVPPKLKEITQRLQNCNNVTECIVFQEKTYRARGIRVGHEDRQHYILMIEKGEEPHDGNCPVGRR